MTEPTYTFVRGQGWIIEPPHPSLTRRFGAYVVTLTLRRPRHNERFWSECPSNMEEYMRYFNNDLRPDLRGATWNETYEIQFPKDDGLVVIQVTHSPT